MSAVQLNRIKIVLVEKGMTNKTLAKKLGVYEPTVSRWCTNDAQPSLYTLYEISKILSVDIRDLLVSTLNAKQTS
jgi:transcriptional regulator with XRE-family HTH domain